MRYVLDHQTKIGVEAPEPEFRINYRAIPSSIAGLHHLGLLVRQQENQFASSRKGAFGFSSRFDPLVGCAFNWFAISLISYLRLVSLLGLKAERGWSNSDLGTPENRQEIKDRGDAYVSGVAPNVYRWRNKVAAHFAMTDPRADDNALTLQLSIMDMVAFRSPYFYVGAVQLRQGSHQSDLPAWSLTQTFEELAPRFWPKSALPALQGKPPPQ